MPAYEDPAEWIVKEANLPENVDPSNSKLKDPEERTRIAKVFSNGLTSPAGYVLPVQAWQSRVSGRTWVSERWSTRRGRLYLVPGDSPVGFRLPLNSLPYISPSWYPYINPVDPTIEKPPLPDFSTEKGRVMPEHSFQADICPAAAARAVL